MPACSTCNAPIGPQAWALHDKHGWPTGEPQCLPCISSSVDHATLAGDEIDHEFQADLTRAQEEASRRIYTCARSGCPGKCVVTDPQVKVTLPLCPYHELQARGAAVCRPPSKAEAEALAQEFPEFVRRIDS